MRIIPSFLFLLLPGCSDVSSTISNTPEQEDHSPLTKPKFKEDTWQYFLQHLPVVDSPVVDYSGKKISDQSKSAGVIPYDVGRLDLQQCADAIMRLRAEYLFSQKQYDQIGFHFVSGQYYSFNDFCQGRKPVISDNKVKFILTSPAEKNHASLRKYLNLVYMYASTISLAKELKTAEGFDVGTVVISPGSPGHCFIIIDKKDNGDGKTVFKLAEGYTPAQSIYILKNHDGTPWHSLSAGVIETASYRFTNYKLGKFE